MSIPSKHGGWKPGCNGRRDGLYPDELGRCDLYYTCQGQLFRGFHSCQHGLKFNPFSSSCQPVREVPFPCGDNEGDMQLCKGKQNGNFLDVFGRCTHYFSCENQTMTGFHVCSRGVYNTEKQRCDVNDADRSSLPAPCGELTNECLKRPDGIYEDKKDMRTKCARQIVCERGLVISSRFSCGLSQ